jgi:hypothetical protein
MDLNELEDMTLGKDGDRSRYQAIVSFMYTYFSAMYSAPTLTHRTNVSPYFENILSYKVTTNKLLTTTSRSRLQHEVLVDNDTLEELELDVEVVLLSGLAVILERVVTMAATVK